MDEMKNVSEELCICASLTPEEIRLRQSRNERQAAEIDRLRSGLEAVSLIPCGIPGHAVDRGCRRADVARAVLAGADESLSPVSVLADTTPRTTEPGGEA